MRRYVVGLAAGGLFLLSSGCMGSHRAIPPAALRSKCEPKEIKDLEPGSNTAILDVCGEKQRWEWHWFNGYEFKRSEGKAPPRSPEDDKEDE